jgi:hypothetical protein
MRIRPDKGRLLRRRVELAVALRITLLATHFIQVLRCAEPGEKQRLSLGERFCESPAILSVSGPEGKALVAVVLHLWLPFVANYQPILGAESLPGAREST